jgi:DNA helicase-2/ATP-dependent DNA helicase PcrA
MITIMTDKEFFKYLEEECNIRLTDAQLKAVLTVDEAIALISTAGSGKTTVITARVAYLILCKCVYPSRIAVTSFSKQSAADMKERFINRFGNKIDGNVSFSTIHSFAFAIVRDYAAKTNLSYEVIEGSDSSITKNQILSNLFKKHNKESINEDKLKELSGFISFIKNLMILFKDLELYSEQFPVPNFKEIYKDYEEYKRTNDVRYLDFDDMLSMCYFVLQKNKPILDKYRAKYDYYMVDEAQDNSKIQTQIMKLLAAPKMNICVCGDDDQSLYSWRGALVSDLLNFKETYHKNGKVLFMEQNFRCSKNIVMVADEFIKGNKVRYKKNIFTENPIGEPIQFVSASNEFKQLDYIIEKLKVESNLKENAVLYRNNLSAVPLISRLVQENIPFFVKDELPSFFNHWVTNDILQFFNFAQNTWSVGAFSDIYYKIRSYIQKNDVVALKYEELPSLSVFEVILNNPTYSYSKEKLLEFKAKFEILAKLSPEKAITYIEIQLNYREYLKDYAKKFNYSMDNIDTILSTLKVIANDLSSLGEFPYKLSKLQGEMLNSKKNRGKNAVTLLAIHSSKGLEFEQVFIMDLIQGTFPSIDSIEKMKDGNFAPFEEEVRVAFVGITRAKKRLHLLHPLTKNNKTIESSQFFKRLYQIANPTSVKAVQTKIKMPYPKIDYKKGLMLSHKKFGLAEVVSVEGDVLAIMLENGSIKKFSINYCEENNLLTLVPA